MYLLTISTSAGVFRSRSFRDPLEADQAFDQALATYGPAYYYRLTGGGYLIREH